MANEFVITRRVHFSETDVRLFIGAQRNNIGYLKLNWHTRDFQEPKSLYIKRINGRYYVSFCYEDNVPDADLKTNEQHLDYLRGCDREFLERHTAGVDRGVVRPVQAGGKFYDFTPEQKASKAKRERYIKRLQRKLAKQQKGSNRRNKTRRRIARSHEKVGNIRKDFAHKTSHSLVVDDQIKIIVFEDLRTRSMTKRARAKPDGKGGFEKNRAKAKSGLNRSILDKGWHKVEAFTRYKAYRAGKAVFKIAAQYTSQECAACGHIHPDNRVKQDLFICGRCGHTDNADHNAELVIKQRAIDLILDSGTELSDKGVLRLVSDIGRREYRKSRGAKATRAGLNDPSKKKKNAAKQGCLVSEARSFRAE